MPLRLSVLDVSPVSSGSTAAQALQNTLDLAQLVDALGYTRYWLAEHHNTSGIASSSPEIMIGHVASVTSRIRVGSGGVMLPNHAPLRVVEAFRVLEALHPGRIDLGLGRAPGTDGLAAFALRRSREAMTADDFPEQVAELLAFFNADFPADHPFRAIQPVPAGPATPPIWLLGSSDFSARLSAELGLGFAFAHHISPGPALSSLRIYREHFRPSVALAQPFPLLAVSVVCAESEAEAAELASSFQLAWLRMAKGERGPFPSPTEASVYPYTPADRAFLAENAARSFVGTPGSLGPRLEAFAAEAQVEELVVMTITHSHAARRRSYELLAEALL